ncbi:LCP family protein [Streptomyces sp. A7024]|uniref:LCP family protein n=1 Tax=Streptomyces coryli TaxID=1128680 RepID=A0A6G4U4S6_9ACTN|nr:LCP family protein [Streptomyces coryli]NGN66740.1 LCP family protein [Streptomyces coryli]
MPLRRSHRLLAGGLAATALATAALGADLTAVADGPRDAGKGTNVLIVGVDARKHLSKKQKDWLHVGGKECDCTDVMMLAHLSADGRRLSVLSIPRDSYVRFAPHTDPGDGERGSTHPGKINGAYAHGGADLAIRTVEQATGLGIDHYLSLTFDGFTRLVDSFGGSKVCTEKRLWDDFSGLHLNRGTRVLDGRRTLRYVRTRHVDPPGDLPRMRRQQRVVADGLARTLASGQLDGVSGRIDAAAKLLHAARANSLTGFDDLLRLGYAARNLSTEKTEFATVPIADVNHMTPRWGSAVKWDDERAQRLFRALRADRPLTPADRRDPHVRGDSEGRASAGTDLLCTD